MAKINTTNYQPVTAWNGTQDLLIVEQPDGTKVATPEQVKQYVEAGDFEATGEIKDGHGNVLADMAKSADVNTALAGKQNTLTFDNTPTQNSNNPVKSGGIYTAIKSQVSVYTMADQSVSVTGPYTDIQLTKPVETGYTFYLVAAFAYNVRNWNLSNINAEVGAIRIFSPENTTVSSNLKTIWIKVKNS